MASGLFFSQIINVTSFTRCGLVMLICLHMFCRRWNQPAGHRRGREPDLVGPASSAWAGGQLSEVSYCPGSWPCVIFKRVLLCLRPVRPVQVSGRGDGDGELPHGHDQDQQAGCDRQPLSGQVTVYTLHYITYHTLVILLFQSSENALLWFVFGSWPLTAKLFKPLRWFNLNNCLRPKEVQLYIEYFTKKE